jgi:hypothetical protein
VGDRLVDGEHRRRRPDDLRHGLRVGARRRGGLGLRQLSPLDGLADHALELRRLDRLGEVVVRALANGVHRALDVGVRGHQDDGRRRAGLADALEDIVPARVVGEVDVAQHDVVSCELGRGRDGVGVVEHVDVVALGAQHAREEARQRVVVFEEQDVRACAHPLDPHLRRFVGHRASPS